MPNWTECDLYIEGRKERVEQFLAFAKGEDSPFDFNRFIPYPERFARLDRAAEAWEKLPPETRGRRPRDGYNPRGYQWCVLNWGTKWNACRVRVGAPECWGDDASVEINFETAWSPPKPVIERAATLFPDLSFDLRYFESGMRIHGQ